MAKEQEIMNEEVLTNEVNANDSTENEVIEASKGNNAKKVITKVILPVLLSFVGGYIVGKKSGCTNVTDIASEVISDAVEVTNF